MSVTVVHQRLVGPEAVRTLCGPSVGATNTNFKIDALVSVELACVRQFESSLYTTRRTSVKRLLVG